MILKDGSHLAYCTNVHPGENWPQTFESLNRWTLNVRDRLASPGPFAIGLRLSNRSALELAQPATLASFQKWLAEHNCYVFTVNGFPYGQFHGTRVKENVYLPDWTQQERLDYTCRLVDLLAQILPASVEGSISTLPGSFKAFIRSEEQRKLIRDNIWRCAEHIARNRERTGRKIILALEPEPCCLFENCRETIDFFDAIRAEHAKESDLFQHLGLNYDACHFAVEFEEPADSLRRFEDAGVAITKIHLSNALRIRSSEGALRKLRELAEGVYLHQVVRRAADGELSRFTDVDPAIDSTVCQPASDGAEWRVHFHVPLYTKPFDGFETTADDLDNLLAYLKQRPGVCRQFEIETYTWAVLPPVLRNRDITEHLADEYRWVLERYEGACVR